MDRSNIINLIKEVHTKDDIGQYISQESARQVFCKVKSISRAEWFDAGRNGISPAFIFIMFEPDYDGEQIVEFNGKRYGIYRTYRGTNENLELYAKEMGGVSNG